MLNAPIGYGKSTTLMKYINESKNNNYIIVIPTTNIANDFYNAFDFKEDSIKVCINDGTFKEIKQAFDVNTRVIITIYHTASRCLSNIIEFTHETILNKYCLFIDEAHLYLLHPTFIEMTKKFNYVGLITETSRDIKNLLVFKSYVTINPSITTHYQRKLFINKLTNLALQYTEAIKLVERNINEYNTIIIKIEDKHVGKEGIEVLLYNGDKNETDLIKSKYVDKSNGDVIMNKVMV